MTAEDAKNLVVLCATARGLSCLQKVFELRPHDSIWVGTFPESAEEPPFVDDIRQASLGRQAETHLIVSRRVDGKMWAPVWEEQKLDLMIVISWRYLIPRSVYEIPVHGTYVFHDSLLPTYRGFAPSVWALINGEKRAGASLLAIGEGVDEGPLVAQKVVGIADHDTIATLMPRVTQCYLDMITSHLNLLLEDKVELTEQDHSIATYTCKRLPSDNCLHWGSTSTAKLYNLIRASTHPYPGAHCTLVGSDGSQRSLKVWKATLVDTPKPYAGSIAGRIVQCTKGGPVTVLTTDGQLQLDVVSLGEGPDVPAGDVISRVSDTLV